MTLYTYDNDILNQTANMMSEVCKDTEIEPKLTPLSGEELQDRTPNNSNKEKVDISGNEGNRHFKTYEFSSACSSAML